MHERIAIIVAMEREIAPLIRRWEREGKSVRRQAMRVAGTRFQCENITVQCAGIGREAARRAAERCVAESRADLIISAGLAGALNAVLRAGEVFRPAVVIDSRSGRRFEARRDLRTSGVLVTADSVVACESKKALGRKYQADFVDMEAAAIADVVCSAGASFVAVKAICDPLDLPIPPMDQFVDAGGRFHLLDFMGWAMVRPSMWPVLNELRRNARVASEALARELHGFPWRASDSALKHER